MINLNNLVQLKIIKKKENDDDDEEENLLADMSNYERPYAYMSSFKFKESCKILVGPVIGKVT